MATTTTTTKDAPAVAAPAADPGADNLGTVARLGAQKAKFKQAAKRLTLERDELRKQVEALTTENGELKTRADNSASAQRVAELEGQIRETNHKAKFVELARAGKARPDAVEDLYRLSGYTPEGDAIDENKIRGLIAEQAKARPYLFGDGVPAAGQGAATTETARPGPGRGQGGNNLAEAFGKLQVTKKQASDPAFMHANQKAIAAAHAKGAFELVD